MPKEPAERRSAPRHCAVLDGQVTDLLMRSKMHVRCSDIAVNGCYLDTLNPLEAGTPVLVRLEHGGCAVELQGQVAYRVPRLGMGVQFAQPVPAEQFATLQLWLEELAGKAQQAPSITSSFR